MQRRDVSIIRVDQLYPFPHKQFEAEMKRYPNAHEVVWCQEEPQNQGAWYQTAHYFRENMREDQKLYYAGRPASASPAGGYMARHNERQKALVGQAFGKYKRHKRPRSCRCPVRNLELNQARRVTRWFFITRWKLSRSRGRTERAK